MHPNALRLAVGSGLSNGPAAQLGPSLSQQKQWAMRPQASIFWDEDVVEAKGNWRKESKH